MRRSAIVIAALAITACGSSKDRSGSVDTTLPNGTRPISEGRLTDAEADNMSAIADNLDAMADGIATADPMMSNDFPAAGPFGSYSSPDGIADDRRDYPDAEIANDTSPDGMSNDATALDGE